MTESNHTRSEKQHPDNISQKTKNENACRD